MKNSEINDFIERMAELGDIWTENQVRDVYGNVSLKEALASRMESISTFTEIISKVINR